MRHPFKMAVRFLLVVAVVATTAYVLAPPSSTGSPYASALNPLTIQPAFATNCENATCNTISGGCNAKAPGMKCTIHQGNCVSTTC